jgi:hypothetical protein
MNKQVVNSPFPGAPDARKHYSAGWIVVESTESSVSIFETHLAVNSLETKAMFRDGLLNQVKHLCPAAENDTGKNQLQHSEIGRNQRPFHRLRGAFTNHLNILLISEVSYQSFHLR